MQYKLLANITNSAGATTELSVDQLELLTDGDTTVSGVGLTSGDEITIVCDLLNRYDLYSCRYYCTGDTNVSIEVAESEDLWYTISSSVVGSYVEADLTSYDPRWVKIVHSVDAPVDVYEVEIYSANNNILFGHSGTFDSYGMDTSGQTVQAVQVYNNTSSTRNIHVFVEDDPSIDYESYLSVGLSSSGTFYGKYEQSLNFPDDFDWDNGVHDKTITTSSGHLTISGSFEGGTYYSPVFDTSGYDGCRFFWEQDNNTGAAVDFLSSVDSENCFGVRRHHIPPSGIWINGGVAEETDPLWSISTGSLTFDPVPNNTLLELRDRPYMQFVVTLSGSIAPHVYKAGVEYPVTVSGVAPGSYEEAYLKLSSSAPAGNQLGLICWYEE